MDDKEFEKYLNNEDSIETTLLDILKVKTKATIDLLNSAANVYEKAVRTDNDLKKSLDDYITMLIQFSKSDLILLQEMAQDYLNPEYDEEEEDGDISNGH